MTGAKLAEWRSNWPLPLAAALGYATCVIHIYGLGVFIDPIAQEFQWTRASVTFGLTLSTIIQVIMAVPIGMAVDRFGPRLMAVVGIVLTCAAFAAMSLATGTTANWYLCWTVMSLASLPIQATVWTSAVAGRFSASRGLALAVTLCGASVALIVFPMLGAWLIANHAWREAMRLEALIWLVVAWPVVFLLFKGGPGRSGVTDATPEAASADPSMTIADGMKSSVFLRLMFVALMCTFGMVGLNVQFPLIVKGHGFTPIAAAGLAALIGYGSIPGRLVTGYMLDRYRASLVGAGALALPAIACLILTTGGDSSWAIGAAALFIGFTLGAEIDVLVFLTTRFFGLRNFGALYGGILSALSVGTAFGPYAAASVYDATKSYDPFIWACFVMMTLASLTLASLPRPSVQRL